MPSRGRPVTISGVTYPSQRAAARSLGVSSQAVWQHLNRATVNARRKRYRNDYTYRSGEPPTRRLDDETLRAVMTALAKGETLQSVAKQMNIGYSSIRRIARGERKGRPSQGETHYTAKLTTDAVRAIRASTETLAVLAERYGVTSSAVSLVRRHKTWKDIE